MCLLGEDPGYAPFGYVIPAQMHVSWIVRRRRVRPMGCATIWSMNSSISMGEYFTDTAQDGDDLGRRVYMHPSKNGTRIMADYVEEVIKRCVV